MSGIQGGFQRTLDLGFDVGTNGILRNASRILDLFVWDWIALQCLNTAQKKRIEVVAWCCSSQLDCKCSCSLLH